MTAQTEKMGRAFFGDYRHRGGPGWGEAKYSAMPGNERYRGTDLGHSRL